MVSEQQDHGDSRVSTEEADKIRGNKKKAKRRHGDESDGEEGLEDGDDKMEKDEEVEKRTPSVENRPPSMSKLSFKAALVEDAGGWYVGSDDEEEEMEMGDLRVESELESNLNPPGIVIEPDQLRRVCKPWRKAVIVKVLGRTVGFRILQQRIQQIWCLSGRFELVGLGEGYYLVRFTLKQDYLHVLLDGPWVILGHYLTVSKWKPAFKPVKEVEITTLVWVRFPGLPIEFFDIDILMRLGNLIGRAIKPDHTSKMQARGEYARICVEIDLAKPLLARVGVNNITYNVEYEGLHMICFHCGKYGHRRELCPEVYREKPVEMNEVKHSEENEIPVNEEQKGEGSSLGNSGMFGEWMMAKKPNRRSGGTMRGESSVEKGVEMNRGKAPATETQKKWRGSRFGILEDQVSNMEEESSKSQWHFGGETTNLRFVAKENLHPAGKKNASAQRGGGYGQGNSEIGANKGKKVQYQKSDTRVPRKDGMFGRDRQPLEPLFNPTFRLAEVNFPKLGKTQMGNGNVKEKGTSQPVGKTRVPETSMEKHTGMQLPSDPVKKPPDISQRSGIYHGIDIDRLSKSSGEGIEENSMFLDLSSKVVEVPCEVADVQMESVETIRS